MAGSTTSDTHVAVLLVAGIGSRLRPLTDDIPKALVKVGRESILERAVRILSEHGVGRFVFATGYRQEAVKEAVGGMGVEAVFCQNPEFCSTQNAVSLALCESAVRGEAFFKLDGDVLFESGILSRLEEAVARGPKGTDLVVAVDGVRPLDAEAMKVRAGADGGIWAFGKGLTVEESQGESIGIERIGADGNALLFEALAEMRANNQTNRYYEDVYSELIARARLVAQAVEVGDLAWTEVDTLEDLAAAQARFG
jgi:choline kinase